MAAGKNVLQNNRRGRSPLTTAGRTSASAQGARAEAGKRLGEPAEEEAGVSAEAEEPVDSEAGAAKKAQSKPKAQRQDRGVRAPKLVARPPATERKTEQIGVLVTPSMRAKIDDAVEKGGFKSTNSFINALLEAYFAQ